MRLFVVPVYFYCTSRAVKILFIHIILNSHYTLFNISNYCAKHLYKCCIYKAARAQILPMKKEQAKDTSKKLIRISSLIIPIIKEKASITQDSITQELIAQKHINPSEKMNTQRRVYDAVNVFAALGIIQKNKKNVIYKQQPHYNLHDVSSLDNSKVIEEKKEKLNSLCSDFLLKSYQIQKNKKNPSTFKLYMPFSIFKLEKYASVKTVKSSTQCQLFIQTKNKPSLIMPYRIIQKICSQLTNIDIYLILPSDVLSCINSKQYKDKEKCKDNDKEKDKERNKEKYKDYEKEKKEKDEKYLLSSIKRESPDRTLEDAKIPGTPTTKKNN